MNLSEIKWDINSSGMWPLPIKIAAGVLLCSAVSVGWVYYDTTDQINSLESGKQEEINLKKSFEDKQKKAANLNDYKEQLSQIESSLGQMLRQMPSKAEVANLLVDISQTGLASGLEFKLFKINPLINQDFYMELPINIEVVGHYEELGLFVSGLASLPRIVTVHNITITPQSDKLMSMTAQVKTYNEADKSAKPAASAKTKKGKGKGGKK